MLNSPLEQKALKLLSANFLNLLFEQRENEWFYVTNEKSEIFSVCVFLNENGLICRKTIPFWKNGSFTGNAVYFIYRKDLQYSKF